MSAIFMGMLRLVGEDFFKRCLLDRGAACVWLPGLSTAGALLVEVTKALMQSASEIAGSTYAVD
ncbi:hypothetical protein [Xanthomonas axonopodis]|uniref:hypothetical protein n=1 Tax=Xanthomonas axonopodis TaxID=53413 RepID=UPI001072A19C|nr:hypothetical protein [Xanthomonas axonopodis]